MIEAFYDLHTCRPLGTSRIEPIPVTAIWQYADRYDCPDYFVDVIRAVDIDLVRRHGQEEGKAPADGR